VVFEAKKRGPKNRSFKRMSARGAAISILTLCLSGQMVVSAAANPADNEKSKAAKSLESILKQAAEDGFIVGKSTPQNTPETQFPAAKSVANSPPPSSSALILCDRAKPIDINRVANVTSLEDITEIKSKLRQSDISDDEITKFALAHIALGLGTEARSLSERIEAPLLLSLSRLVADEAEKRDITFIQSFSSCGESFAVWDFAAHIAKKNPQAQKRALTPELLEALAEFPVELRKQLEIKFATYAAETADFKTAEQLFREHYPEVKFGDLPHRKDDEVLYLHALILQHKNDDDFAEILNHLAVSDGLYKTKAVQALAQENVKTGRALPASFENELNAIDYKYGDAVEGKAATLELVRFRADKLQFTDAINTAKLKFSETDIEMQDSVTLIANKISDQLSAQETTPRLYALDGYFHDPEFFKSYARLKELIINVHAAALDLGLPELASQLSAELEALNLTEKSADVKTQILIAQAELAVKNESFEEAIKSLEGVKSNALAEALRQRASLASGDRELVQRTDS